jgi:DNA (cytosine-5)-methyltransferase 1
MGGGETDSTAGTEARMNEPGKLNGLDLFSGIGGIALALQPWVRTVAYCEIDAWCQAVLWERMRDGRLDVAPVWDDITTFDPRPWAGAVDIVSGGFPCQDISAAGRGAGLAGERSGLFFEIARIVRVVRPGFIYLENVPAITAGGRGGWDVIGTLAALGYDCRWGVLSAFDVGAPHIRERWWCLGYANRGDGARGDVHTRNKLETLAGEALDSYHSTGAGSADVAHAQRAERGARESAGHQCDGNDAGRAEETGGAGECREALAHARREGQPAGRAGGGRTAVGKVQHDWPTSSGEAVAHAANAAEPAREIKGGWPQVQSRGSCGGISPCVSHPNSARLAQRESINSHNDEKLQTTFRANWWATEPDVGRVAHGVPARVDRLRALGNSVVPAAAQEAFNRLMFGE